MPHVLEYENGEDFKQLDSLLNTESKQAHALRRTKSQHLDSRPQENVMKELPKATVNLPSSLPQLGSRPDIDASPLPLNNFDVSSTSTLSPEPLSVTYPDSRDNESSMTSSSEPFASSANANNPSQISSEPLIEEPSPISIESAVAFKAIVSAWENMNSIGSMPLMGFIVLAVAIISFASLFQEYHPALFTAASHLTLFGSIMLFIVGSCIWLLVRRVLLPIWRLHLRSNHLYPLSCESIRVADYRDHWKHWAKIIDRNNTATIVKDNYGEMNGMALLQLMETYQSKYDGNEGVECIVLRFFPTVVPEQYGSWKRYLSWRRSATPTTATDDNINHLRETETETSMEREQSSGIKLDDPLLPAPPSLSAETSTASTFPYTPFTPFTPVPPVTTSSSEVESNVAPIPTIAVDDAFESPTDDTVALVFITAVQHDLSVYFPTCLLSVVRFLSALTAKLLPSGNVTSSGQSQSSNPLQLRMGIIGFQWPFRSVVVLTKRLEYFRPIWEKDDETHDEEKGLEMQQHTAHLQEEELRHHAAVHSMLLRVTDEWNRGLLSDSQQRCAFLLHVSIDSSAQHAAAKMASGVHVHMPPTYIVDLTEYNQHATHENSNNGSNRKKQKSGDATRLKSLWSLYTRDLRKSGKRIREAPFLEAGGTARFTRHNAQELSNTLVGLWTQVSDHAQLEKNQTATLFKPNSGFIQKLLEQDLELPEPLHFVSSTRESAVPSTTQEQENTTNDDILPETTQSDLNKSPSDSSSSISSASTSSGSEEESTTVKRRRKKIKPISMNSNDVDPLCPASPKTFESPFSALVLQVPAHASSSNSPTKVTDQLQNSLASFDNQPLVPAASSIIFNSAPHLITSDLAGFDYPVLDELQERTGHKIGLYAVKAALVLRRGMKAGVSFVDFGPTLGVAKKNFGAKEVPLSGCGFFAHVHLMWFAQAAAFAFSLIHATEAMSVKEALKAHLVKAAGLESVASNDDSLTSTKGKDNHPPSSSH